ncbi:MAG: alpha-xylosidase [Fimbriimonadaceae bacterium]
MKFTDGNWLHLPGVVPHYAAEAYEVREESGRLVVLAPCQAIRHRGDTLAGPVLTVALDAPLEGAIRVRVEHFQGVADRGPRFRLAVDPPPTSVSIDDAVAALTSGPLTARIDRKSWRIDFEADGRALTSSPPRGTAMMETTEGKFIADALTLGVGELVFGLGERFTALAKNGQSVEMWNRDGGTNSEQAYKNIPFYLTNRGYGVFVNHSGRVSFEIASERTNRVNISVPGEWLEYVVLYGPTPKDVLRRYTALVGRPALPPAWSFGLWLSTSFTTSYDESTVGEFVQGMADRDIPLSVFHYDCFWMRGLHWCDFEFDPDVFPDPRGMIARLHERGLRVCVWINPYIAQASRLFPEARDRGYLLRRANGDIWQWDLWQPGMAVVDFTNPEAKTWFQQQLGRLIDLGVDALKTDFGERIPTDVVYHDGSDPDRMHNFYAQIYNETVFEILEAKRGRGEAVLFARSATAGGQKFPVHWGGDCWSTFEAMAESLRGGLSLGQSGFGFWSHDIGGFEGRPPIDLYVRWVQFGLLSSHSRLHGSASYRVPWQYDDPVATDALRRFTKLKHRLMPYLWAKAVEAHRTGVPVLRAMSIEFPDDPACDTLDRQYMLGDRILVAPVFSSNGEVEYYVPSGRWTHLLAGEEIVGGRWVRERYELLSLPILVRPNTLLPIGARDDRPDYDYADGVTLEAFAPSGTDPDGPARTEVWVPGRGDPVLFDRNSPGVKVVTRADGRTGWRQTL